MPKKKTQTEESWHYCHECQIERGGKVPKNGHQGITVMFGKCLKCGLDGMCLIPNADYDWPKSGKKAWFD